MSVLDLVAGELEPTATYRARRWAYLPADANPDAPDHRAGTLTIVLEHARRNKVEADSYAVAVEGGEVLLAKQDDSAEVYGVTLAPPHCTCTAANCGLGCKHLHAVAALAAESPELLELVPDQGRAEDSLPECFRGLGPAASIAGVPF